MQAPEVQATPCIVFAVSERVRAAALIRIKNEKGGSLARIKAMPIAGP